MKLSMDHTCNGGTECPEVHEKKTEARHTQQGKEINSTRHDYLYVRNDSAGHMHRMKRKMIPEEKLFLLTYQEDLKKRKILTALES